ncbi:ICE-like protease (caspase) p20 domain protein [Ceratobasidium sp. AG-Ba]|nr:ICE-like protease (caspase) p20 domain protein [Ceratobasidium sp. AG-Ba]
MSASGGVDAHLAQGVSQAEQTNLIHPEVGNYIRNAIRNGSKLGPYDDTENIPPAERRALIVAPLYNSHVEIDTGTRWAMLKSTATDAKLVHEMLVKHGYDRANIRVLSDVCGGFRGLADPTKENILSSLEWLTANTRPGDYRFFHFSGHGERIIREKDQHKAKQARRVIIDALPKSGDTERDDKSTVPTMRIKEQIIPIEDLAYYNEGIVTRSSELRAGDSGLASRIMDHELNDYFSRLHEESVLTVRINIYIRLSQVYQPIYSYEFSVSWTGRIVCTNTKSKEAPVTDTVSPDNDTKALGPGFRGRPNMAAASPQSGFGTGQEVANEWDVPQPPPTYLPPVRPTNQPVLHTNPSSGIGSTEENQHVLEILKAEKKDPQHTNTIPGGLGVFDAEEESQIVEHSPALVPAGFIRMLEEIPEEERRMDHIKAKTFVWTGCHQRQEAWGHDKREPYGWGVFTKAFTDAFKNCPCDLDGCMQKASHPDYNAMFETVSNSMIEETREIGVLQFAQLWTSLHDTDETKLTKLLGEQVII